MKTISRRVHRTAITRKKAQNKYDKKRKKKGIEIEKEREEGRKRKQATKQRPISYAT